MVYGKVAEVVGSFERPHSGDANEDASKCFRCAWGGCVLAFPSVIELSRGFNV